MKSTQYYLQLTTDNRSWGFCVSGIMFSRWMYALSFTGVSNVGGGRINTPPPEAAMPEVEEKNKPTG